MKTLSLLHPRDQIVAIMERIYAHEMTRVSFSICGQVPDKRLFPEAWHVCGRVAFAPYALPGSVKLGARIAEQCGSKARPNCVVLENHGVVVGDDPLPHAFERFETLEFTGQIILNARLLGKVNYRRVDRRPHGIGRLRPFGSTRSNGHRRHPQPRTGVDQRHGSGGH